MSRGWRYEVWSEPDPHVLENVRFLEWGCPPGRRRSRGPRQNQIQADQGAGATADNGLPVDARTGATSSHVPAEYTVIPARRPDRTPDGASSMTRQSPGSAPSRSAARGYGTGEGLPFSTAAASTITSGTGRPVRRKRPRTRHRRGAFPLTASATRCLWTPARSGNASRRGTSSTSLSLHDGLTVRRWP